MAKRKSQFNQRLMDRDEESRHQYKIQKRMQNKKMMKHLESALRNKDYAKLMQPDEF